MNSTHRWVRRVAYLVAGSTVVLIFAGSLVTSTGSGLAVPDWPLSYGQLFPPMIGGILYEHGHRMIAGAVALMVLALNIVVFRLEQRRWVRRLAVLAAVGILSQAALGGITVLTFLPTAVSMTHALVAQTFFLLVVAIAYALSPEGDRRLAGDAIEARVPVASWRPFLILVAVIYLQLILGAYMRHSEAGLAVLDYPLVAGQILPAFDDALLGRLNQARFFADLAPVQMFQVVAHVLHRLGAAAVAVTAVAVTWLVLARGGLRTSLAPATRMLLVVDGGILLQVVLGALTVVTRRIPVVASLHVVIGALTLAASFLALLRGYPLRGRSGSRPEAAPGSVAMADG